jgi:hypothetical protein
MFAFRWYALGLMTVCLSLPSMTMPCWCDVQLTVKSQTRADLAGRWPQLTLLLGKATVTLVCCE